MGLFGNLFGGGKKVQAPVVQTPSYDQFNFGLANMGQELAGFQRQQQGIATNLGAQIPGMLSGLDKAPQLGVAETQELDIASQVYKNILKDAQLNLMNAVGQQSAGSLSNIAGGNVSTKGAFSANILSGIQAKAQGGINEYAGKAAEGLMNLRQGLLSGVYGRLVNKLNATAAQQAQASGQAQGAYGTLAGQDAARRQEIFNTNAYNAQMQMSADATNSTNAMGFKTALMGGIFNLAGIGLGGAMGGFGKGTSSTSSSSSGGGK